MSIQPPESTRTMAGSKRGAKKAAAAKQRSSSGKKEQQGGRAEPRHGDLISKLPDDILARILSLVGYKSAVRASATCRRWKDMHLRAPHVCLCLHTASAAAARSMERMLLRRQSRVERLRVVYAADVAAAREGMARLVALAGAPALEVHATCASKGLPVGGAGAWSLELPPGTAELALLTTGFAIRFPAAIHGPGAGSLRALALEALLVLRLDTLAELRLPSLERLSVTRCTLAAGSGMAITPAAMPRLRHLTITDVSVEDAGNPGKITVDAEELSTLHMSCRLYGKPLRRGEDQWAMHRNKPYPRAGHTVYSSVHLRTPKLRVLSWRVCWAYEVRVHSVGRLSDVAVELAYGVMPRILPEEVRTITKEEAHALMGSILSGLWPGLRHLGGGMKQLLRDVCELDEEQKLLCEISTEDDDDLIN